MTKRNLRKPQKILAGRAFRRIFFAQSLCALVPRGAARSGDQPTISVLDPIGSGYVGDGVTAKAGSGAALRANRLRCR